MKRGNDTNESGDTTAASRLLLGRDRFGPGKPSVIGTDRRVMKHSQVPGEVHIKSVLHSQVVAQKLQWDDVEQSLEAVDRPWNANRLDMFQEIRVVVVGTLIIAAPLCD